MNTSLPQTVQKPVLPLILHNGQWRVAYPASRQTHIAVNPQPANTSWLQQSPPPAVQWLASLGVGFALVTGGVNLFKTRMDIAAQQYKALLEGGDQGPLKVLNEASERSVAKYDEPYDNDTLNTLEVQEASAKVNSALKTIKDKGLLTTKMGKRLLAGNKLKLNRVVIENHNFSTRFHPINQLKRLIYPTWWQRQSRMQSARRLTQKRLTQTGQHQRWWFEWWKPGNQRTHLLDSNFDQTRMHNNQFNQADMSETSYQDGRWYQNDFVQTRLVKSTFDRLYALFNNLTDARVNGSTFNNSRWVGLHANGLDARPHLDDQNLNLPSLKAYALPSRASCKSPPCGSGHCQAYATPKCSAVTGKGQKLRDWTQQAPAGTMPM
jgi:hypothetical protein